MSDISKKVVIVGGGTGGISVANALAGKLGGSELLVIEPSEKHYYQPYWTLVGGGIVPKEDSARDMKDFIPSGVEWLKDYVESFQPEQNQLTTKSGKVVSYEYLVVAPGIQIDWDKIPGLKETLGKNGVVSNYSYNTVDSTWEAMRDFKGGKAIFTFPNTPIKCAGAPQKVMWLAEEQFRINGVRDQSDVIFATSSAGMFGVEKYKVALTKLADERNIIRHFRHNLVAIDGEKKVATFENLETGDKVEMEFDMIHVTPPMSSPDFIKKSPLANEAGWVDVDKFTTQHTKYENIFSLGDASSLPTSKTGAAIRKEGPVLIENLLAHMKKAELKAKYNGYASCPMVTSRSTCMMIEFDYDGNPMETFPVNQAKERFSMYLVKRFVIPFMYWNFMMRGKF